MMPSSVPVSAPVRRFYGSFLATSTMTGLVLAVAIWLALAARTELGWVAHGGDVSRQIGRITALTHSLETGERVYLLTRDEHQLAATDDAARALIPALDQLGWLVGDDPSQRPALDRLKHLVSAHLTAQRADVEAVKAGRSGAVAVAAADSPRSLEPVRAQLSAIDDAEQQHLAARRAHVARLDLPLGAAGAAAFIMLCLVGFYGLVISRRAFIEIASARNKLIDLNRDILLAFGRAHRFEDGGGRTAPDATAARGGASPLDHALKSVGDTTRTLIRHERSLREEEQRVSLAHDAALAGVWEWGIKDDRNHWGESIWALYGLAPKSCAPSYEAWIAAMHPDDRARATAIVQAAAADEKEFEIQWRVNLPAEMPERWLLSRGRPHFGDDGQIDRYVGIVIDITGRRRVEEALRRSERQMNAILSALPIGVALVDTEGRTIIDNEFYRRLVPTSVPSRDEDRRHLWEATDDDGRPLDLDDYPAAKALRGIRVWPGQLFLFHGDPARGPFWAQVAAIPLQAEDGRIIGATVVVTDVDDERRAQAALRASEEEFRAFFETAAVGTVELQLDGRFLKTNARFREITGYSSAELAALTPLDITHPDDRDRDHDQLMAFLRAETPTYFSSKRFIRKDGEVVWIEVTAAMVRDAAGTALRTAGVVQDITDRKTAEDALRAAEARLLHASRLSEVGQMAAALAHELNQPLAALASYMGGGRRILSQSPSQGSSQGAIEPDQRQKLMGMMEQANAQALRAGEIIRRMRALVRVGESEKAIANATAVMADAACLATVAARHGGVAVEQDFAACGMVLVDKIQIEQVVLNLVRNAVEAMAASPIRRLTLTLTALPEHVQLSIADTGTGLPEPIKARLFSPFSSTKEAGMGIGLSVCREIIESHGGKIWAEANPSGGTTFRFTLPLIQPEELQDAEASADPVIGA